MSGNYTIKCGGCYWKEIPLSIVNVNTFNAAKNGLTPSGLLGVTEQPQPLLGVLSDRLA